MVASTAVQLAVPFFWLGMVAAISFLEAPLKFRAPGITVPLGVGIGRLVFRALNLVEAVLAAALLVATLASPGATPAGSLAVLLVACAVLVVQAVLLRPAMDRSVVAGAVAHRMPRTLLHVAYIGLEGAKVVLLLVLGLSAVLSVTR